jgi:hypothetical protein
VNADDLLKALKPMIHSRVHHYATPGLTSVLVGGSGHGKVRMFLSDRDTREWITPHSHRFDFTCLVLRGTVENIVFTRAEESSTEGNWYASALIHPRAGGMGGYYVERGGPLALWRENSTVYREGDTYSMTSKQIHSIRFSRDSIVLFFEGPEVTEDSVALEPFSNGELVRTFDTAEWMFKRVGEK